MKTVYRIITNSERGTFACQRKWAFRYLDGLTTARTAAPLKQGSLWHQCLEYLFQDKWQTPRSTVCFDIAQNVIEPWLDERLEKNKQSGWQQAADNAEDTRLAHMVGSMLAGYVNCWSHDDAEKIEVIAVEGQVCRLIVDPETGKALRDEVEIKGEKHQRIWCYGGAVDLVYQDKQTGEVCQGEWKTTSQRDLVKYMHKLHWDPQIRGYLWAMREPVEGLATIPKLAPNTVLYDAARKAVPSIPKPLKSGKGLSKAKSCDTTADIYRLAVKNYGFDEADYEDVINNLPGWESFFHREEYRISEAQLDDFGVDIYYAAKKMMAAETDSWHPRQTQVCLGGINPLGCTYSGLCIEDGKTARESFRIQGVRHVELEGDMAEPYVAAQRGLTLHEDGSPGNHPRVERPLWEEL